MEKKILRKVARKWDFPLNTGKYNKILRKYYRKNSSKYTNFPSIQLISVLLVKHFAHGVTGTWQFQDFHDFKQRA